MVKSPDSRREILDALRRKSRPSDWLYEQVDCAVLEFTEALLQLKECRYIVLQGGRWYITRLGIQAFLEGQS